MVKLRGADIKKEELRKRIGDMSQVCGLRHCELKSGNEKGVEAVEFRTGSGLNFTVVKDRGMDISSADYSGKSLCWLSSTGMVQPSFFEPEGFGWLRNFFGGLLTTGGLTYTGRPSEDNGKQLGLHGRINNVPARNLMYDEYWEGNEYLMYASGKVRETSVFGENIQLTRKISARLGESRLWIDDTVENLGFQDTDHMILYHVNIGYPVLDKNSVLETPAKNIVPRDKEAEKGIKNYMKFGSPVKDFTEQCYYHEMKPDRDGKVTVSVYNSDINFGVYMKYDFRELPEFVEWKMIGEGLYVLGIEPANSRLEGRANERKLKRLQVLKPGEKREYHLEIGIIEK